MKLKEYDRFLSITKSLTHLKTSSLIFQTYIEEQINDVEYTEFFKGKVSKTDFYIRLKNPNCSNSKDRGLKVCLNNDSMLKEKKIESGTVLFKFEPMLKVIGFTNENCSQCSKAIVNLGKGGEEEIVKDGTSIEEIKCDHCNLRKFCSQECKIKAMLEWHDLECDFINFVQKELIMVGENGDERIDNDTDQYIERIILIIITTFRLLIKLVRSEDSKFLEIVINMSDHMNLYKRYIEEGKCECDEHEAIFKETQNTFGPLLVSYFAKAKKDIKSDRSFIGGVNKDGVCRGLFLVFVNVSSVMDNFNNNLGLMFDPIFSMMNHSCKPNCTLIWKDSGEILVKNVNQLKASEEMTLNYIPIQMPREMRQKQLLNSFFFHCECYQCAVLDKKYDRMLPIMCVKCNQKNSGFQLENFEEYDNLPKHSKIEICCNCEEIIPVEKIFDKYLEIFKFFKSINGDKKVKKLADLCNWSLNPENVVQIDDMGFRSAIRTLKCCFGVVPLKSWPMIMLLNIIKVGYQIREPFNIVVLRLTFLTNFLAEYFLEDKEMININIGTTLYDLSVASADYLFDQYLRYKSEIDKEIVDVIGRGTFSLCILAHQHLANRFKEGAKESSNERSQQDLVQLALEVKRLLEHIETQNAKKVLNNKSETGTGKTVADTREQWDCYFRKFSQMVYEQSLLLYERHLLGSVLRTTNDISVLFRPLSAHEETLFGVAPPVGVALAEAAALVAEESEREKAQTLCAARENWVAQL